MLSSSRPSRISLFSRSSSRPVLMMSLTMIGLEVAPLAPHGRLRATSSGSTESSQSLVPQATSDSSGVMAVVPLIRGEDAVKMRRTKHLSLSYGGDEGRTEKAAAARCEAGGLVGIQPVSG